MATHIPITPPRDALQIGLDYIRKADLNIIHTRVTCLVGWLLQEMTKLVHKNGQPLIQIYGPTTTHNRGGTIAFNLLDPMGNIVDERIVEQAANARGISLRTGCFCNPGAGEIAFQLSVPKLKAGLKDGRLQTYDPYLKVIGLQSAGAIRISVGLVSNFADARAFLEFAKTFADKTLSAQRLASRKHC